MNETHFTDKLINLDACEDAVIWATQYKTWQEVWDNCERADWLLWIAGRMVNPNSDQHKQLVLCACKCARRSLKYLPKNEKRPLIAIETAERWAKGKATIEEVKAAAWAARDAAWDAARDAAWGAGAGAAGAAAGAAARKKELKAMSKIVRKMIQTPKL